MPRNIPVTGSNSRSPLSLPFESIKKKKERNKISTVRRSYGLFFCTSSRSQETVFCRRKDSRSDGSRSKMKPFLFSSWLLACLVPCRGLKPDGRRSPRRRRLCDADHGTALPKHWQEYGCKFYQRVLAKLSLVHEKA